MNKSRHIPTSLLIGIGALIGAVGLSLIPETRALAASSARDGVFIHLADDDTHAILMGLKMAQIMAEDKDVLVYVDVEAIPAVLKNSRDLKKAPFDSSHTAIRKLLKKGVTIMACPGCLKAAGKTPDQLMPGIKVAEKDAFFNFTKGRILSLDY